MPLPKEKEQFTYQDYLTWPDDERWELIDGFPYNMSAAPNLAHQRILGNLFSTMKIKLKVSPCVPWIAPVDVVFSDYDVVQPDFFVVCDPKKMTEKNIQGAPDLVIEILSPYTSKKDQREKRQLYEKYSVREYILIDPEGRYVRRTTLGEDGRFGMDEILGAQEILALNSLPGIEIPLWEIFEVEKEN